MRGSGCLRPLLVSMGVVLLFFAVLAVRHRDVVRSMWQNARAMGRSAAWTGLLKSPDDLYAALRMGTLRGSVVVLEGKDAVLLDLHADSVRTVFGVTRLDVLDRVLRAVECGGLDPEQTLSASLVEELFLPISQGTDPPRPGTRAETVHVREIVRRMMVEHDQAAQDWLILHLAADSIKAGCHEAHADLPTPFLALLLGTLEKQPGRNGTGPPRSSEAFSALVERFRSDPNWRSSRRQMMQSAGSRFSIQQQEALAARAFHHGTVRRYARLLQARLETSALGIWPDAGTLIAGGVISVGGAFPGVISLAAGQVPENGRPIRTAVLLLEDLPTAAFYHLIRTGMDRALLLDLLAQPERFIEFEDHDQSSARD